MNRPEEVVDEIHPPLAIIGLRLMVQIAIKNDHARCDRPHAVDLVGDRAEEGHLTGNRERESHEIEDPVIGGLETGGHTPEVGHGVDTVDHEAGEGEKEHHLGESLEIEGTETIDKDWTTLLGGVAHFQGPGA